MWRPINNHQKGGESQNRESSSDQSDQHRLPGTQYLVEALKDGGREIEYLCTRHGLINPLWVEDAAGNMPACQDCFLDEIESRGEDLADAEEIATCYETS